MRWTSCFALLIVANQASAQATDYLHVNSGTNSRWQDAIRNFLNETRPELTDIHCMLSNGRDFHIWVKPGNSENRYSMSVIATNSVTNWQKGVGALIESRTGLPCAFNAQSEIWIINAN